MGASSYTDDEFKKVLKNLFAEKKRVLELQKQLEVKQASKNFPSKPLARGSLLEENAKLKAVCDEKTQECEGLKRQLVKVKPALKKLIEDLKSARFEIERMKQERLESIQTIKPAPGFEILHEENKRLNLAVLEAQSQKEEALENAYLKMRELSSRHGEALQEKEFLQKKMEETQQHLARKEKEHGELQLLVKHARLQNEEKSAEIRKVQLHLAKKIKETTLLSDLVERQKEQLENLQVEMAKQRREMEHLKSSLQLSLMHEEKLQSQANEKAAFAENVTKEWKDKYLALENDWQEKKAQLIELQKMRKTYEQMSLTFSSLKSLLGNAIEPFTSEENHLRD